MARKTVYNSIVSDVSWNQVSKENKEVMNEFLDYCKSVDKSPTTIKAYNDDLESVLGELSSTVDVLEILNEGWHE